MKKYNVKLANEYLQLFVAVEAPDKINAAVKAVLLSIDTPLLTIDDAKHGVIATVSVAE